MISAKDDRKIELSVIFAHQSRSYLSVETVERQNVCLRVGTVLLNTEQLLQLALGWWELFVISVRLLSATAKNV